jgi:hypothetical protein
MKNCQVGQVEKRTNAIVLKGLKGDQALDPWQYRTCKEKSASNKQVPLYLKRL